MHPRSGVHTPFTGSSGSSSSGSSRKALVVVAVVVEVVVVVVVVEVSCPRCGYRWRRRSRRLLAKCPNCGYTFRVSATTTTTTTVSATRVGGAYLTVVRESVWQRFITAARECAARVGGTVREGEGGADIDVPDERLEEFRRCLEEKGVALHLKH